MVYKIMVYIGRVAYETKSKESNERERGERERREREREREREVEQRSTREILRTIKKRT